MTDAEIIAILERRLSEARADADKGWAQARGATKTRDALQVKLINMANERDRDLSSLAAKNLLAAANERAEEAGRQATAYCKRAVGAEARCAGLERERDEARRERDKWHDCHAGPGTTQPACEACTSCLTRRCAELEKERDEARDLLPGLNAQVDALFARVEALERALKEARAALQLFSCGHDLVCADPACRESGHEHEGYGEDWYCAEYCPCAPACAGFEPETCPGSRIVSKVIEEIGAMLASKELDHV